MKICSGCEKPKTEKKERQQQRKIM